MSTAPHCDENTVFACYLCYFFATLAKGLSRCEKNRVILTALQPFFHCHESLEGPFYLKQHLFFLRHPCALGLNMRPLRISPVLV